MKQGHKTSDGSFNRSSKIAISLSLHHALKYVEKIVSTDLYFKCLWI